MKTVNSVSGGKSSGYLAVHYPADYDVFALVCLDDCRVKDEGLLRYAQEKLSGFYDEFGPVIGTAESDETLAAMRDLEQYIGREITWVRGPSFDRLLSGEWTAWGGGSKTRLPSWARRYCTAEMKLVPIFLWWWRNFGEAVEMRIGFRSEEFGRMMRYMHRSPWEFRFPTSCSLRGRRQMRWESFRWRQISFPLIEHGVDQRRVADYWAGAGWVKGDLFQERRRVVFPSVSNCVGCFHKSVELLAHMAEVEPEKMGWFAAQEEKGMGRWKDKEITYQQIIEARAALWKEVPAEIMADGETCAGGECTA